MGAAAAPAVDRTRRVHAARRAPVGSRAEPVARARAARRRARHRRRDDGVRRAPRRSSEEVGFVHRDLGIRRPSTARGALARRRARGDRRVARLHCEAAGHARRPARSCAASRPPTSEDCSCCCGASSRDTPVVVHERFDADRLVRESPPGAHGLPRARDAHAARSRRGPTSVGSAPCSSGAGRSIRRPARRGGGPRLRRSSRRTGSRSRCGGVVYDGRPFAAPRSASATAGASSSAVRR